MRPRGYKSRGIALRQHDLGEADRILSILTPNMGKARVIAKGVRRPKSKLRGHLDLTNVVDFSAAHGRNLDIVTEAQVVDDHPEIRADLSLLSHAIYVCELADSFSEERSPNRVLYLLTIAALGYLPTAPDTWLAVRWFESKLLDATGFRPELEHCVGCGDTLERGDHVLALSEGGMLCPRCRPTETGAKILVSESAMRVLRHLRRTNRIDALGTPNLKPPLKNEVEWIQTRYLRFVLERELKSADFVKRVGQVSS